MFPSRFALRSLPMLAALLALFAGGAALAQVLPAGGKVTVFDPLNAPRAGTSGALSSDGSTLVVGGPNDNSLAGCTFVFTRSNGIWAQLGVTKFVANDAVGAAQQGSAVAMSGDGNTFATGGPADNSSAGATWIFTRAPGSFAQQGSKLVGSGAVGNAHQGFSVALSSDGNTLAIGAPYDNGNVGAVWVFTRTGTSWAQQGSKLVATGETGPGDLGYSVGLAADGNTLVAGSATDNGGVGAAFVFTRTGSTWAQQGTKLVGTGAIGGAQQGISVAISADGTTFAEGGNVDNSLVGATWVFARNGGGWVQQGNKLVGTGGTGASWQGLHTALSANGNVLAVGGPNDNSGYGAMWVFTHSDGAWSQVGGALAGSGATNSSPNQGSFVSLSADGNTIAEGGPLDGAAGIGAIWFYLRPGPHIVSVTDVPNDQGGEVSVRWTASQLDVTPSDPVSAYGIWRQAPAAAATPSAGSSSAGSRRQTTLESGQTLYWELVGTEPAHGFAGYSFTAPTTSDSIGGSNPRTIFMVETQESGLGQYYPGDPDSGYSVDNLGPLPPAGAAGTYVSGATQLFWNPNTESDLEGYRVYRGIGGAFPISPANRVASLGSGTTSYNDPAGAAYVYELTAVDIHGNESAPTLVVPAGVAAVGDLAPGTLALAAPRPNPAAGAIAIRFELPFDERALLAVYDVAGRRVRTVVDGAMTAGEHTLRWDPRSGSPRVGNGIYFLHLTAGGRTLVQRLAVVG